MEKVYLVSKRSIQSDMLARFIQQELGVACFVTPVVDAEVLDTGQQCRRLVLWDCSVFPVQALWETINLLAETAEHMHFALINVVSDRHLELEALAKGAHGVFSRSDDIAHILNGIRAIIADELWFPRRILSQYLNKARRELRPGDAKDELLTTREREILGMVAKCKSNKEISARLHISISTVKSHLYNTFSKIEVPNRTQAALWAARNL